jgi:hypothetical protein
MEQVIASVIVGLVHEIYTYPILGGSLAFIFITFLMFWELTK